MVKLHGECLIWACVGTKLRYKPGVLTGGRHLVHDCGTARAIGYFLEPLVVLGLFGKKPLSITLQGITNDDKDPCVDTFRTTTLPMLKHFGVPTDELELKIVRRGAPPQGGGEVVLKVPQVSTLSDLPETRSMPPMLDSPMFDDVAPAQCGHLSQCRDQERRKRPLIFPVSAALESSWPALARSPGYGVSLVAETTTGCLVSAESAAEHLNRDDDSRDAGGREAALLPEDVGTHAARCLLQQIKQGGVVDSTHQGLLFLLCALCPEDVSKVRSGPLTPQAIRTLRDIKEFLGVQFNIKPDASSETVILSCIGSGFKNMSKKIS
eukprot:jgi/Mesen1/3108/ME000184S02169